MAASDRRRLRAAAALGAVSGARTFAAPGVLAIRGRWGAGAVSKVLPALAVGEIVFDKLPVVPPRSDPPSLLGRLASGAATGAAVAGPIGAGIGAAGAAATTLASERARSALGRRVPVPDAVLGLAEDALVIGVAAAAASGVTRGSSEDTSDGDEALPVSHLPGAGNGTAAAATQADDGPAQPQPGSAQPRLTPLGAVLRGVAAAAVGTAAMTTVQSAYMKASGGSSSGAPGEIGRRVIEGVAHQRVPRKRREALNEVTHFVYGTLWGVPFGLVAGTLGRQPPASALGAGLALTAWGSSLVGLPILDVAPPPQEQSVSALASDLMMHLVYGTATAAAYIAFGG